MRYYKNWGTSVMQRILTGMVLFITTLLYTASAQAITLQMQEYLFNIDGTLSNGFPNLGDPMLAGLDANGLGTLNFSITGTGSHSAKFFFDYEIDENHNGTRTESGSAHGTLAAGQSWEIDEPGFAFGDIYDHVLFTALDNSNGVPAGSEHNVSFALGWDFTLAAGETAQISLTMSDVLSTTGFYLQQTDARLGPNFDQTESFYFWSDLTIIGAVPVTEPGTLALLSLGLISLGVIRRRKTR